ncbi:hypothetical protein SO802_014011 [Lithocarpus litseifolius]|uniref:Aminotransferase-like plant mobile domain-containing protein n=1 Tax=Lithocarpus litseifolius TaxID=425828 RepID=A0AAW2D775_9ROSI
MGNGVVFSCVVFHSDDDLNDWPPISSFNFLCYLLSSWLQPSRTISNLFMNEINSGLWLTGTAYLNLTEHIGEELSILVKLLSEDAPQMAMSYILMQVAIEKDPEAEWQSVHSQSLFTLYSLPVHSLALCHPSPLLSALRSVFPTLPHSPSVSLSLSSLPYPLRSVVVASVESSPYPPSLITSLENVSCVNHDAWRVAPIARLCPETHTFHLPHGEMGITLQDIEMMLGISVDGLLVTGKIDMQWSEVCRELLSHEPPPLIPNSSRSILVEARIRCKWLDAWFVVPPAADADDEVVQRHAHYHLLVWMGALLFMDNTHHQPVAVAQAVAISNSCLSKPHAPTDATIQPSHVCSSAGAAQQLATEEYTVESYHLYLHE